MKLEQGDAFEKAQASWLRLELPHYEPLWASFIGHDNNGKPLPIQKLSTDKERSRKKLYQAHYSAALGCFQIEETMKEIDAKLGEVKDVYSLMREQRHLNSLMSFIGQVRDMYKQMDEALGMNGEALAPLQDFYALRSHVMHGPIIPFRIIEGLIKIPPVAKQNKTEQEWDDKSYWDDFNDADFVFLDDFCTQTKADFFDLTRRMHAKIYSKACDFFGDKRIDESMIRPQTTASLMNDFPALSACSHL